ncbi:hypothetical protein RhoFasB10_04852 [Rhodococcus sp. B10]|nr:hypothetical protein [Rhodococcus sp. B10]
MLPSLHLNPSHRRTRCCTQQAQAEPKQQLQESVWSALNISHFSHTRAWELGGRFWNKKIDMQIGPDRSDPVGPDSIQRQCVEFKLFSTDRNQLKVHGWP